MKKIHVDFSYVGTFWEIFESNFHLFANRPDIGANISGMGKARSVKFSMLVRPQVQIKKK